MEGFYVLPIGLSADWRSNACAVRVITLTVGSNKVNEVFNCIMDYILEGISNSSISSTPFDDVVRMFHDPVFMSVNTPPKRH